MCTLSWILVLKKTGTIESRKGKFIRWEMCRNPIHDDPNSSILATLMAAADGEVDDDEKEVLQQIVEHFGMASDSMERLLKWTSQGYTWMQKGYDILNDISE